MKTKEKVASPTKCGWRVTEWGRDVGLSRAYVWRLISDGTIKSVKSGGARIILTPPAEYLASLAGEAA